jgi:uncharacterized membrane protein YedE/YeeE
MKNKKMVKETGLKKKKTPVVNSAIKVSKISIKPARAKKTPQAVIKTEKSITTIGNELVNIGGYIGGRRFLRFWGILSLIVALFTSLFNTIPAAVAKFELTGDIVYNVILNTISSTAILFAALFLPMMLLVIACYYLFIDWKLPNESRAKMSKHMKISMYVGIIGGILFGIMVYLMANQIIPNTYFGGDANIMAILMLTLYGMVAIFFGVLTVLGLYKELTFMFRKDCCDA